MASAPYSAANLVGAFNATYIGHPGYAPLIRAPYAPAPVGNLYPQAPPLPVNSTQEKLVTKVEIHVSCANLRDKDVLSKSDPMVVLFVESPTSAGKEWKEIGRTEIIRDNLNPKFTRSFAIDYRFEELQKLKFEVYDCDSESQALQSHDFLGRTETTLGSIVGENGGHCTKRLHALDRSAAGTITIDVEQVNDSKEIVSLHLKGRSLDKKDFFGSSDPFLVLFRSAIENESFHAVHRSEVVKHNLNPMWKPFTISAQTLCNGDSHRPIKIECYDWDSNGSHDLIGLFKTTLHEMKTRASTSYELVNPKKKAKKKGYKNSGFIDIIDIDTKVMPSFLDYIYGGTELCFHVAIDFTASNGNPQDPHSLHFRSPYQPNMYVQALAAVGRIVEDYDSDKIIPSYGFGARILGNVYHDFHLNQLPDPNCQGVDGVLDAYNRSLGVVELYGPTNFSPVINRVAQQAASSMQDSSCSKYHVLLIITDGVISDMDQTKQAIVCASPLPLSIIIVGVGNAPFDAMEELDSDGVDLRAGNRIAQRDIVQFVPFRKFLHEGSNAAEMLASEVLYEVPHQLVSYMEARGMKPGSGNKSPKPRRSDGMPYHSAQSSFQHGLAYGGAPLPSGPTPVQGSYNMQHSYALHPSVPTGVPLYGVPAYGPAGYPAGPTAFATSTPFHGGSPYVAGGAVYNLAYMSANRPGSPGLSARGLSAKEAALEAMGKRR